MASAQSLQPGKLHKPARTWQCARPICLPALTRPAQCANLHTSTHVELAGAPTYLPHVCKHRVGIPSVRTSATQAKGAITTTTWGAPPVVLVGAGIAGLATALALHKVGIPVVVLEAAGEGQREGEGAAIGLWENAWVALDALGVAHELRPQALRLNRVELVTAQGRLLRGFGFNETDAGARPPRHAASVTLGGVSSNGGGGSRPDMSGAGSEFRGLRRADLLRALAGALPPGVVRAGSPVARVEWGAGPWPTVDLEDGRRYEGAVVVGADGARSVVAGPQGLGLPAPAYAGYSAYRGVATLPGGLASVQLPSNTIRQVWGQGVRAGLYPINDQEVYWFTCFTAPQDAPVPSSPEGRQAEALSQVKGWAWGVEQAIQATPAAAISRSRIVDRWTAGSFGKDLVTLCGDAAHPMTPNLGQGGCTALEDAVLLARALATVASSSKTGGGSVSPVALEEALRAYESERSARCLPLSVRSHIMGVLLQLPYTPVIMVRDWFVSTLFPPSHFLDHTVYDCGTLPGVTAQPQRRAA